MSRRSPPPVPAQARSRPSPLQQAPPNSESRSSPSSPPQTHTLRSSRMADALDAVHMVVMNRISRVLESQTTYGFGAREAGAVACTHLRLSGITLADDQESLVRTLIQSMRRYCLLFQAVQAVLTDCGPTPSRQQVVSRAATASLTCELEIDGGEPPGPRYSKRHVAEAEKL